MFIVVIAVFINTYLFFVARVSPKELEMMQKYHVDDGDGKK